jgi:hypothetical protein
VESDVHDLVIATGLGGLRHSRWVGGHSRNPVLNEQFFDIVREPGLVPWLEHDVAIETRPQIPEERRSEGGVKGETGWKLDEDGS